ncbi:SDR family oxidoreductase [Glaciecola sp. MH2013]|uniref:SDR family NAD(P)-dependent oxidoreductase n=1 Tax=Glaciecola sp. MH2013 TaxID=2785524 RepID=UPI00189F1616|nr:SDR family oxidoreductase [Glaciecola sp. MH2013]MBF7071978.1 SDR family oxidoreductase [Glaciecola sp. MH2013]
MPTTKLIHFYQDKAVVVTGAASGIGLALAHLFAELGCKLALCDIDKKALNEVVKGIESTHPNTELYHSVLDVADEDAWVVFLAETAAALGGINLLINNAGIEGSGQPVWASTTASLKRVMDVNFYGMAYSTKHVLPYLSNEPWAALINVSSIFGLMAPPNTADYCASKFAIRGYTESLKAELALVHPHIQVHLVHPGGINTNITRLEHSQRFKERFLKTEPSALANKIANAVMHNRARIVYGYQSQRARLAARILPLAWLSSLLGKLVKGLGLEDDYHKDHSGFTTRK